MADDPVCRICNEFTWNCSCVSGAEVAELQAEIERLKAENARLATDSARCRSMIGCLTERLGLYVDLVTKAGLPLPGSYEPSHNFLNRGVQRIGRPLP